MDFLSIKGGKIIDQKNQPVNLRGVNLGGWLMMEGYILGGRNIAEYRFKGDIAHHCGRTAAAGFEEAFRRNYISKIDFQNIRKMGANVVRLPFHYKLVTEGKWQYLDEAVREAKKNKLYVILDLHAAPGAQNADWHSDSTGKALLWSTPRYQKQLYQIWKKLAERYRHESTIAAYDVLNEAVGKNTRIIREVYLKITEQIRAAGDRHILFIEGNNWSQEFDFLGKPWDNQLAFSFHYYWPLEFTFNFVRNLTYPGKINGERWDIRKTEKVLMRYKKLQTKWNIPIYCGEFGVNSRCPGCGSELQWVKDVLDIFNRWGVHYTYWTYKAVAGGMLPDGIYQYLDNPAWVNRWGMITGVETFAQEWPRKKKEMTASWQTRNFVKNQKLSQVLKKYFEDK